MQPCRYSLEAKLSTTQNGRVCRLQSGLFHQHLVDELLQRGVSFIRRKVNDDVQHTPSKSAIGGSAVPSLYLPHKHVLLGRRETRIYFVLLTGEFSEAIFREYDRWTTDKQ